MEERVRVLTLRRGGEYGRGHFAWWDFCVALKKKEL